MKRQTNPDGLVGHNERVKLYAEIEKESKHTYDSSHPYAPHLHGDSEPFDIDVLKRDINSQNHILTNCANYKPVCSTRNCKSCKKDTGWINPKDCTNYTPGGCNVKNCVRCKKSTMKKEDYL